MEKNKKSRISIYLSYATLLVSIVGSFLVTPIILREVGDRNYGFLSFSNSITIWLSTLSTALGSSFIYFLNKEKTENNSTSTTTKTFFNLFSAICLIVGIILYSVLLLLFFSDIKFGDYTLEETKLIIILLMISGVHVLVASFLNIFHLYLIYQESFVFIRLKNLLIEILSYGLNVFVAIVSKSIILVCCVTLVTATLNGLLNLIYAVKIKKMIFEKNVNKADNKKIKKDILIYSSFIFLNVIIETFNNNSAKTLLGIFSVPEFVTLFQLSFNFYTYLYALSGAISETNMPKIHELYSRSSFDKNEDKINSLFLHITNIEKIIIVMFSFGFLCCGYEFISMWIGESRISVYYYSLAIIFSSMVSLTTITSSDCEKAIYKHKFRAILYIALTFLNIIISFILLKTLDYSYSIWCCIISTAFVKILGDCIILPIYDKRKINLPMEKYYLSLLKTIAYGTISSIPSLFLSINRVILKNIFLTFLAKGMSFILIYMLFIFLFEKKDIKRFFGK